MIMIDKAIDGKVVVITGASGGIGREMAYQFVRQGANVVLASRNEKRLTETAEECRQLGGKSLVVQTDVANEADCRKLMARTVNEFGKIDILVNNAGITVWGRFEDMKTMAPFEQVMRVNYLGSVFCTHYALPHLLKTRGRIAAISSMAGKTGVPLRSGYAASKYAMGGFFETLRIELLDRGVSVTMVFPDFVQTGSRLEAYGVDGELVARNPERKGRVMGVEEAGKLILKAVVNRDREMILSRRGKAAVWLKLLVPGLIDRMAAKVVERTQ
jgi:NAD(P)-dependent dehydrogenase (short-subunit alcohol dehydrogenase family)